MANLDRSIDSLFQTYATFEPIVRYVLKVPSYLGQLAYSAAYDSRMDRYYFG
jgi:hypothetical protein